MKIFRSAQEWERTLTNLLKETKIMAYNRTNPPDPYKLPLAALRAAAGKRANYPPAPTDSNPPGKHLAAASAANRLLGPSRVKSTPDPYVMLERALAASDLTPDLDPNYKPYARPADGYKIALAARKIR